MTSKSLLVRKYAIFIVAFLVIIVAAIIFSGGGSETIKIGVVAPLSGSAGQFGQDIQSILDYQVENVNENAKASKVQFELVYQDGQCATQAASDAYKKLTQDENVQFILGGACSNETLAIAPFAEDDKVLVVSPTSSASQIENYNNYVFSLSYPNTALARELAQELAGYEKIALLSEDKDYTRDIRDLINTELQARERANRVVFDKSFSEDATVNEYQELLEELVTESPDVIFLNPNVGQTAIDLVEQMQDFEELSDVQLYGQVAFVGTDVIQAAPDLLEGMIIFDQPAINNDKVASAAEEIKTSQSTELSTLNNYYIASILDSLDILTGNIIETLTDDNKQADPTAVRNALRRDTDKDRYLGEEINFGVGNIIDLGIGRYHIVNGEVEPWSN